jgi:hypothetical protein
MIEGDGNGLSSLVRALVGELKPELAELDQRIAAYDRRIRNSTATMNCVSVSARLRA